jgi:hypothetical protein
VNARTASTVSRTLRPSVAPYSVLITQRSGNDCRWLLDIEPRGMLAGETPADSMACLPSGEGLAEGDDDNSAIDRAELLVAPLLTNEHAHAAAELARSGTLVSSDEERWYVMCAAAPHTLKVHLDSPDYVEFSSCSLSLQLLDAHGQVLAEADEGGKAMETAYNVSAGRRYYVKLGQEDVDARCRWSLRVGPAVALADVLPTRR